MYHPFFFTKKNTGLYILTHVYLQIPTKHVRPRGHTPCTTPLFLKKNTCLYILTHGYPSNSNPTWPTGRVVPKVRHRSVLDCKIRRKRRQNLLEIRVSMTLMRLQDPRPLDLPVLLLEKVQLELCPTMLGPVTLQVWILPLRRVAILSLAQTLVVND